MRPRKVWHAGRDWDCHRHVGPLGLQSASERHILHATLGMAPEPERCRGCYSVLWTGITGGSEGFRPVCHATIRNVNEWFCAKPPEAAEMDLALGAARHCQQ